MRQPRIVEPGRPHHVVLRARRPLFGGAVDHRRFLGHLAGATLGHPVALHHLCLMPDHVALIATPAAADALGRWVRDFAQPYAQHRNRRAPGPGRLFAQRYRSTVLADDRALLACTAAVELAPVRAGLAARAVEHPWSSARLWAGDPAAACVRSGLLTPSPFVVDLASDVARRADQFAAWLALRERELPRQPASSPASASASASASVFSR